MMHPNQPAAQLEPLVAADYERFAAQLLRALRAGRSQEAFNRRLGYDSNVSYLWESGRRAPNALAFFQALVVLKRPVGRHLRAFGVSSDAAWAAAAGESVAPLLRCLACGWSRVELSHGLAANRTTVGRWLKGDTVPRLPQLLAFVQRTTRRLPALLELFFSRAQLERIPEFVEIDLHNKRAVEQPWIEAVLSALELPVYARGPHRSGVVARILGISEDHEHSLLKQMAIWGMISFDGQRFVPLTSIDPSALEANHVCSLGQHWMGLAKERLGEGAPGQHRYELLPVSSEKLEGLQELTETYWRKVKQLADKPSEGKELVLVTGVLLPLARRPASSSE